MQKEHGVIGAGKSARDLGTFDSPAQGTIEYLVILAIIVVVALIVVSLMVNSTAPAGNISGGVSKLSTQSAPISIVDASVNPDGEVYLKLGNNVGENVEITKITVDGEEVEPNTLVAMNSDQGFLIMKLLMVKKDSKLPVVGFL